MTDEDMHDLDRIRVILDPAGILNRSELIRRTIAFVLEDFNRWQGAALQGKNIPGLEVSQESE